MKIKFSLIVLLILASETALPQTTAITNFNDLMTTLNAGGRVRIVINYSLCSRIPEKPVPAPIPGPNTVTGMDIDVYEYFAAGSVNNKSAFVVFSNAKLIQNPIGKGFVYNYGKVRINSDNSVLITSKFVNSENFKVIMEQSYTCKINDGNNNEGLNLFNNY